MNSLIDPFAFAFAFQMKLILAANPARGLMLKSELAKFPEDFGPLRRGRRGPRLGWLPGCLADWL